MKTKAIVCALALTTLGAGSLAFAQNRDWRGQQQYDNRTSMHGDGRQFGDHEFEHHSGRQDRRANCTVSSFTGAAACQRSIANAGTL